MRPRLLLLALLFPAAARAGGGPETTIVVVNATSPMSRLVANEYASLRDIPPSHIVHVEGVPHLGVVPLDLFLDRLWRPVAEHVAAQGLEGQIDLVLWSVDFPYAVDFSSRGPVPGPHASLTGLTFLLRRVEAEEAFWDVDVNDYYGVTFEGGARRATAEERALILRADAAMKAKRWADAADAYATFLRTYESHDLSWYNYARCLAQLGRKEEALAALGRSVDCGFRNADHAAQDPDLASLRALPGFEPLLRRMSEGGAAGVQVKAKPSRGYRARDGSGYLSTQLGYTGRFGNSVPEILAALRSSAAADGTAPEGTVYFCRNGDIRSKTREPFWPALAAELGRRGRKSELVEGVLPPAKEDVIGAVLGSAGFSWPSSKSRLLPGSICEHLTSFGAHFGTPGQTKLSELVRFGAAGTSGTVTEPYAIHQKFPNPLLHVFYADGCSLAEAFFQSVSGPYQLMVAGDGLARPFARFEKVEVSAPPFPWSGTVRIDARAAELWVDGRRVAETAPFDLDTTLLDDGWHDVRVVAVAEDPVGTRSFAKLDAIVMNRGREVRVKGGPGGIEAKAAGAKGYRLLCGARVIATSPDGAFRFDAATLGPGPVELLPVADFEDGSCRGTPVQFVVAPPPAAPPVSPDRPVKPGIGGVLTGSDGQERPVAVTNLGDPHAGLPLADQLGVAEARRVVLDGLFEADRDGLYQLMVTGRGRVTIEGLCRDADLGTALFLPMSLAKGVHPLRIEYEPQGRPDLTLMLGGEQVLAPPKLTHATFAALAKPPEAPKGLEALVDGSREGKGLPVPEGGLVLTFKATTKEIAAVTIFPGSDSKAAPGEWVVETTLGSKWLPVKDLRTVVARPPSVAKDQPEIPLFVELSFAPTSAKKVRLAVKGEAHLAEVEVLGLPKPKKARK